MTTRHFIIFGYLCLGFISDFFVANAFSLSMVERGTVVVAGATGYIGKSTVRESVRQGYKTVALVRNLDKVRSESGQRLYSDFFHGAQVVECDVTDRKQLEVVRKEDRRDLTKISSLVFVDLLILSCKYR